MRIDHVSEIRVEVTLSERNLVALLNKVRREGSARTLEFWDVDHERTLVVRAEPDDAHYRERIEQGRPPGEVYPGDLEEPLGFDEQPTRVLSRDDGIDWRKFN